MDKSFYATGTQNQVGFILFVKYDTKLIHKEAEGLENKELSTMSI